jgi:glycerol-3-phosphate dehydrogenase
MMRAEQLERLRRETFDLAVIGGGINGAALARDAQMRGLRVALFDKGDFASATSSRSSKLIHGGLRYLPQGQLKPVYEALRERERLRRLTAPHLVHPIKFLFPLYRGRGMGRFVLAIGLTFYDLFARTPAAERHKNLKARIVMDLEPALTSEGLRGGAMYFDGFADDARLTLENALDAGLHGAAVANYVAIERFSKKEDRIECASLVDQLRGDRFEIRARVFVNAAGPWVDDIRRMDDPQASDSVRLTKGVHLIISRDKLPVRNSLVLADRGGRILFVMPQERNVLVGTTDTDFNGDRDQVTADRDDISYVLSVLRENIANLNLTDDDVLSSYAGLRALLHDGDKAPSRVPREETILESRSGLISVAGGKLTTHRLIAQKLTDRVLSRLGRPHVPCPTLATPLPGARPLNDEHSTDLEKLNPDVKARLLSRYGTRAALVAKIAADRLELLEPLAPGCPVFAVEVIYAMRAELAVSMADFLVRRTGLIWRYPRECEAAAPAVARLMAQEQGWTPAREQSELAGFAADLRTRRAA